MPTFVHFETLRARVASHPNTPVFKLPKADALGREWVHLSYMQFHTDIERMAKFWFAKLSAQHILPRSVVGIWLRGFTYADVITIFSVSRAGFIPQMFAFDNLSTNTVFELLTKYDGKAIIHDPAKTVLLVDSKTSLPCHVAVDCLAVIDRDVADLKLPDLPEAKDEDIIFIYHTSGSVSGTPKLVPKSNKWMSAVEKTAVKSLCVGDSESQDVYAWTGSFSHCMAISLFQLILHRAACLVQPSRCKFDSHELASMICEANLNRFIQYSSVLRENLEDARAGNPENLLPLLKTLRQVTYLGMPFSPELEDWAVADGIRMTAAFGSTECGQLLASTITDRRLEILPGVLFQFVPVAPTSIRGSEYSRLLELCILPDSPDAPHHALCGPDGILHSGDLFEEAGDGKYRFRGRDNDWITTREGHRVDTKAIEDNICTTCSDIVADCVVVGSHRPFPALFIEPRSPAATGPGSAAHLLDLKREIIKRTSAFHALRPLHERIQDVRMVKVVPGGSLPRTPIKRTIRRPVVEQEYADDLEAMYLSFRVEDVAAHGLGGRGIESADIMRRKSGHGPTQTVIKVAASA